MFSNVDLPVLVLNKSWIPIGSKKVRDIISDTMAEKTQIICPDTFMLYDINSWINLPVNEDEKYIRLIKQKIRVPEVVINKYDKFPKQKVCFSRKNLWKRDKLICQYCSIKPSQDEITIDHVIPKHQGGVASFANCVLACFNCNAKKRNRTPEQAGMRLRRTKRKENGTTYIEYYDKPIAPKWSPLYAVKRMSDFPKSWPKFIQHMIDELYWNTELED